MTEMNNPDDDNDDENEPESENNDEIAEAARRLNAEEADEMKRARAAGTNDGRFWALNLASPAELRRMERLFRDSRASLEYRVAAYIGTGVPRLEEAAFETIRHMVHEEGGPAFEGDVVWEYWKGFEDGALTAYDQLKRAT